MSKIKSVSIRFAKAFLAGGVGAIGALFAAGLTIKSLEEAKQQVVVLATAFLVGGLMAVEKALNWQPVQ